MDTGRGPLITFNNGVKMPALGLGVFQSPPEQTAGVVEYALNAGYRLIDTAAAYLNERQVGEGIRRSGIDRSQIFVTTKLWMTEYGYEPALRAFDASLRRIGTDYIDLYLLHWPSPREFEATLAAYRAIEKMLVDKRARAIGVSNFNPKHLDTLIERCDVVPAVNQVELHPFFIQREVREVDTHHGIVTQSWSPLGGVYTYGAAGSDSVRNPLTQPVITELADKYGKTPAQIVLRWHIDHGFSAIPKSVRPERILENIDIFDFKLTAGEIEAIDALDSGVRGGGDPEIVDSNTWPTRIED